MAYKKILIILFIFFIPSFCFALDGTFNIDSLTLSDGRIDIASGSDTFYSLEPSLFDSIVFSYQSGSDLFIDYESGGLINFISLDSDLYPVNDFSKIVSFLIGGISAFAFCLGCVIRF